MKLTVFILFFLNVQCSNLFSQTSPVWIRPVVTPWQSSSTVKQIYVAGSRVNILVTSNDTLCNAYSARILQFGEDGLYHGMFAYDTTNCVAERPVRLSSLGNNLILSAIDSANMTQFTKGHILIMDTVLNVEYSIEVCDSDVQGPFINQEKTTFGVFGGAETDSFFYFDSVVSSQWIYSNNVAFAGSGYKKAFYQGDSIYMVGGGDFLQPSTAMIYLVVCDSNGTMTDVVTYDKYSSGANLISTTELLGGGKLFYSFSNSLRADFDFGVLSRSGVPEWERNIDGVIIDAVVDSTLDNCYLLSAPWVNVGPLTLRRIDLSTGATNDSVSFSCLAPAKSKLRLDTGVGAVVVYLDSAYYKVKVARMNCFGFVDWTANYNANQQYTQLADATLDSWHSVYCSIYNNVDTTLVMKFNAPPLGVGEGLLPRNILTIHPNPACEIVSLELGNDLNIHTVMVSDAMGRQVMQRNSKSPIRQLDISGLADGIYTVSCIDVHRCLYYNKLIICR